MLYLSLFLSLVLLLIAFAAAWRSRRPALPLFLAGLVLSLAPFAIGLLLPVVALQALLLVVLAAGVVWRDWRPARFALLSCAVTLAAYAVVGGLVALHLVGLAERFPYVSMEERLAPPKAPHLDPLPELVARHLTEFEELLTKEQSLTWSDRQRRRQLERLHEQTLQTFVNQPGFGVARMSGLSERSLRPRHLETPPLDQPGARLSIAWSTGDLEGLAPALTSEELEQSWRMHAAGLGDFVFPQGFGYVKDRRHVAGFLAHRFRDYPWPEGTWQVQTVDLLGLLLQDEPMVYVSEHLPRMDELRNAPRRPPDDFEIAGLLALRAGEDLFVREGHGGRRLLGAIRNATQCAACHGGERGDLLGAFSYTLMRK